jgi:hypothetical protein
MVAAILMKWKQFIGSLQAKEPKIHYKVGVFSRLKRILPDKVYEKMLNHYKL